MGMTITQKLICKHSDKNYVQAGELIDVCVDLVLGNDITSPVAIDEFYRIGAKEVFDKSKIALVLDHFVPNKDIKAAQLCKKVREFAKTMQIENFFDVGQMGIEHVLIPEMGLALPNQLIIGADSHTCTYGALGALSTGVGSTDMAFAMITGKTWLKVPSAIKIVITGKLPKYVSGKDVILYIIGKIGVDGAIYKSLEFYGDGILNLSMDDRFTIANMAVECGAKNAVFPVDEVTKSYLEERVSDSFESVYPDNDAEYDDILEVNLSELTPLVAYPNLPENVNIVDDNEKIKIDQVVIGSCTNGRISDLRIVADIMKGNSVAEGVRTIIIPGSQKVYLQALKEGLIEIFIESGAVVSTPTCGPCLGGYMGVLAENEVCVSTTNRNFVGRMGHKASKVYLSNPAVAAKSAITGYISLP